LKNDENNSPNSQPPELNDKTLLQYFQQKNIKSIKLEGGTIIIEYNNSTSTSNLLTNFPELKGIDKYLQNKSDKIITKRELELSNNSDTTSVKNPENNNLLLGCVIGGTLIIGIITVLLLRKSKIKKH